MLKVLVVDDQVSIQTALQVLLELHDLPVLTASTPDEALSLIASEDIGVVVQDMNFGESNTTGDEGTALLRSIKRLDPDLPVLLMTAWTSLEAAVQLVKDGASDYIGKPWDDTKLVSTVKNLMKLRELQQENTRLQAGFRRARGTLAQRADLRGMIYASPQMHEVLTLAVKVAPADVSVLLLGPNGSGKEQLAEILQANSRRRDKPFVKVNAGGLPDELLEAELFGAEAGAFTGATRQRIGRFEEANGGTLFLDEIGNLSLSGQMKLLRVLQVGEFQRLGSNVTRKTDVRIISATNANLSKAIREGTFREDLFHRLGVIEITIPSLKDRPDDIPFLAEHFLSRFAGESEPLKLGPDVLQALTSHDWSGNVRELQNRIQRATLVRSGPTISAADLGLSGSIVGTRDTTPPPAEDGDSSERAAIEQALREHRGVVAKAAAQLGLSRQALYRRMERLGLEMERRFKS
jgi:DNA-binding NtrC family response regulator